MTAERVGVLHVRPVGALEPSSAINAPDLVRVPWDRLPPSRSHDRTAATAFLTDDAE